MSDENTTRKELEKTDNDQVARRHFLVHTGSLRPCSSNAARYVKNFICAVFPVLTLLCTLCNGQSMPSDSGAERSSTPTPLNALKGPPQASQPQAQVLPLSPDDLTKARTLSADWSEKTNDINDKTSTYVKIGGAIIGIVAAGVGGGMRLDKHYTRAGTALTAAGGVVGGGLNIFALIKDLRDKHGLNAQYGDIPQSIQSYIRRKSPKTNIQTLPTHPGEFSNILDKLQLDLTLHQQ
jgi:hypothetical protein